MSDEYVPSIMPPSEKELRRAAAIEDVLTGRLSVKSAAEVLDLKPRQIRRLKELYVAHGVAGLVSRKRGRPSNRTTPAAKRTKIIELVKAEYAHLKTGRIVQRLAADHGIRICAQTLARWMLDKPLDREGCRLTLGDTSLLLPWVTGRDEVEARFGQLARECILSHDRPVSEEEIAAFIEERDPALAGQLQLIDALREHDAAIPLRRL